jgi:hypothetical protein
MKKVLDSFGEHARSRTRLVGKMGFLRTTMALRARA